MKGLLCVGLLAAAAFATACGGGSGGTPTATDAFVRGLTAQTAGKYDEAATAYYEVLAKEPKSSAAFFNLGLIAQLQNRPVAAESYYRLSLEQDPTNEKSLFNLAIVRANAGAPAEAADLYRKVLAKLPSYADAHFNLALLLRQMGQTAEAQQEFAKAQQLDPKLVAPGASASPARPATSSPRP